MPGRLLLATNLAKEVFVRRVFLELFGAFPVRVDGCRPHITTFIMGREVGPTRVSTGSPAGQLSLGPAPCPALCQPVCCEPSPSRSVQGRRRSGGRVRTPCSLRAPLSSKGGRKGDGVSGHAPLPPAPPTPMQSPAPLKVTGGGPGAPTGHRGSKPAVLLFPSETPHHSPPAPISTSLKLPEEEVLTPRGWWLKMSSSLRIHAVSPRL